MTTYVVTIHNEGKTDITNVVVRCSVSTGLEILGIPAGLGPLEAITFRRISKLAPGEKKIFKVQCKAVKTGSLKFSTAVIYDEIKSRILDEEGTSAYQN